MAPSNKETIKLRLVSILSGLWYTHFRTPSTEFGTGVSPLIGFGLSELTFPGAEYIDRTFSHKENLNLPGALEHSASRVIAIFRDDLLRGVPFLRLWNGTRMPKVF